MFGKSVVFEGEVKFDRVIDNKEIQKNSVIKKRQLRNCLFFRGEDRIRTDDLLTASQAL